MRKGLVSAIAATGIVAAGLEGQAGVILVRPATSQNANASLEIGIDDFYDSEVGPENLIKEGKDDWDGTYDITEGNGPIATSLVDSTLVYSNYKPIGSTTSTPITFSSRGTGNLVSAEFSLGSGGLSNFPTLPTEIWFQQNGYSAVDIGDALRSSGRISVPIYGGLSQTTGTLFYGPEGGPSQPAPEPSTFALIGAGYAAYLGTRRRNQTRCDKLAADSKKEGPCGYDCR